MAYLPYMSKYLNLRANIALGLILAFFFNSLGPLPAARADEFHLPLPGAMVHVSPEFNPPLLKGIKVHPDNPFQFEFILDQGDSFSQQEQLKTQATKLIKYFLASLTIPDNDLWVNLSPYEKNRIIPPSFGLTEMGRDLLAEDYMLKQITASLIYPEGEIGKKFWKLIYEKAYKEFGTTNIPVNTFNKVWIVPEKAVVYENAQAGTAYVVESKLKVMLEEDYLSMQKHAGVGGVNKSSEHRLASSIIRQVVIPELTKEVNQGQNFAQLRQVYNSLILATWYKKKIKDSILAQVYENRKKVAGVGYANNLNIEAIYQRYLQAFKKGAYNYIKEDQDPVTQETIPRKYFSGGADLINMNAAMSINSRNPVLNNIDHDEIVRINLRTAKPIDNAMLSLRLTPVLRQTLNESQRQELKTLLLRLQVDAPVPPNAVTGKRGLEIADKILRDQNAVGIVIGSTSASLYNRLANDARLQQHKDIDVVVLSPHFKLKEPFEGGIDWWVPKTVKVDVKSDYAPAEGFSQEIYVNGNNIFIGAAIKTYQDLDRFESGLYLPSRDFLINLTEKVVMSRVEVAVDWDVQEAFRKKLEGMIANSMSPVWKASPFDAKIFSHVYADSFETRLMVAITNDTPYNEVGDREGWAEKLKQQSQQPSQAMATVPLAGVAQLQDVSDPQRQAQAITKIIYSPEIRAGLLSIRNNLGIIGSKDVLIFKLNGHLVFKANLLASTVTSYEDGSPLRWRLQRKPGMALTQNDFFDLNIQSSKSQENITIGILLKRLGLGGILHKQLPLERQGKINLDASRGGLELYGNNISDSHDVSIDFDDTGGFTQSRVSMTIIPIFSILQKVIKYRQKRLIGFHFHPIESVIPSPSDIERMAEGDIPELILTPSGKGRLWFIKREASLKELLKSNALAGFEEFWDDAFAKEITDQFLGYIDLDLNFNDNAQITEKFDRHLQVIGGVENEIHSGKISREPDIANALGLQGIQDSDRSRYPEYRRLSAMLKEKQGQPGEVQETRDIGIGQSQSGIKPSMITFPEDYSPHEVKTLLHQKYGIKHIIGFSTSLNIYKEDIPKAIDMVRKFIKEKGYDPKETLVVSGATFFSGHQIIYGNADETGIRTMGVINKRIANEPFYPLDFVYVQGDDYADEVKSFAAIIDEFVLISGGPQAIKDTKEVLSLGKPAYLIQNIAAANSAGLPYPSQAGAANHSDLTVLGAIPLRSEGKLIPFSTIGEFIKYRRQQLGMSTQQLAEKLTEQGGLKVFSDYIDYIERSNVIPTYRFLSQVLFGNVQAISNQFPRAVTYGGDWNDTGRFDEGHMFMQMAQYQGKDIKVFSYNKVNAQQIVDKLFARSREAGGIGPLDIENIVVTDKANSQDAPMILPDDTVVIPEKIIHQEHFLPLRTIKPLTDFSIDPVRAREWVEMQNTPEFQELAQFILDHINYIPQEKLEAGLQESMDDFMPQFKEPYVLVGSSISHSEEWMYGLALERGFPKAEGVVNEKDIQEWLKENPHVKNVVILDDAAYSGQQLERVIKATMADVDIHVVIPFMTQAAEQRAQNISPRVKIYKHRTIESMDGIFGHLDPGERLRMRGIFDQAFPWANTEGVTLTYFQHKNADYQSFLSVENDRMLPTADREVSVLSGPIFIELKETDRPPDDYEYIPLVPSVKSPYDMRGKILGDSYNHHYLEWLHSAEYRLPDKNGFMRFTIDPRLTEGLNIPPVFEIQWGGVMWVEMLDKIIKRYPALADRLFVDYKPGSDDLERKFDLYVDGENFTQNYDWRNFEDIFSDEIVTIGPREGNEAMLADRHGSPNDAKLKDLFTDVLPLSEWREKLKRVYPQAVVDVTEDHVYVNRATIPEPDKFFSRLYDYLLKIIPPQGRRIAMLDTNPQGDDRFSGQNIVDPLNVPRFVSQWSDDVKDRIFEDYTGRLEHQNLLHIDHHYDHPLLPAISTTPLTMDFLLYLHRHNRQDLISSLQRSFRIIDHSDADIVLSNFVLNTGLNLEYLQKNRDLLVQAAYFNDYLLIPEEKQMRDQVLLLYGILRSIEDMLAKGRIGYNEAFVLVKRAIDFVHTFDGIDNANRLSELFNPAPSWDGFSGQEQEMIALFREGNVEYEVNRGQLDKMRMAASDKTDQQHPVMPGQMRRIGKMLVTYVPFGQPGLASSSVLRYMQSEHPELKEGVSLVVAIGPSDDSVNGSKINLRSFVRPDGRFLDLNKSFWEQVGVIGYGRPGGRSMAGGMGKQPLMDLTQEQVDEIVLKLGHIVDDQSVRQDLAMTAVPEKHLTPQEIKSLTPEYGSAESFFDNIKEWEAQNPDAKLLVMVRHGESGSNLFHYSQSYDAYSPLTVRGLKQRKAMADFFLSRKIDFDWYVSSDLERANDTLKPLAEGNHRPVEILKRFREVLTYPIGGVSTKKMDALMPGLFTQFMDDPIVFSLVDKFSVRKLKKYISILFENIKLRKEKRTMIATHGVTMVLAIMELLNIDYGKYNQVFHDYIKDTPNLGLCVFAFDPHTNQWRLLVKPDNSYLPKELQGKTTGKVDKIKDRARFYGVASWRLAQRQWGRKNTSLSDWYPNARTFFSPSDKKLSGMIKPYLDNPEKSEDQALRERIEAAKLVEQWNHSSKQQRAQMLEFSGPQNRHPFQNADFLMYVLLDSNFDFRRTVVEINNWGVIDASRIADDLPGIDTRGRLKFMEIPVASLMQHLSDPGISIRDFGPPALTDKVGFVETASLANKRMAILIAFIEKASAPLSVNNQPYTQEMHEDLMMESHSMGGWSNNFDQWFEDLITKINALNDSGKNVLNVLGENEPMTFWEAFFTDYVLFKWFYKNKRNNPYEWLEGFMQKFLKNFSVVEVTSMVAKIDRKFDSMQNGGIDLTPANMNLQTRNGGAGIKFHMDPAMLAQLQNAPGFVPVIISIQPLSGGAAGVRELRQFLAGM